MEIGSFLPPPFDWLIRIIILKTNKTGFSPALLSYFLPITIELVAEPAVVALVVVVPEPVVAVKVVVGIVAATVSVVVAGIAVAAVVPVAEVGIVAAV